MKELASFVHYLYLGMKDLEMVGMFNERALIRQVSQCPLPYFAIGFNTLASYNYVYWKATLTLSCQTNVCVYGQACVC